MMSLYISFPANKSWANSSIDIYEDGKKITGGTECAIPGRLGRYFFVGSDNSGQNSLNGRVESVKVYLKTLFTPSKNMNEYRRTLDD